MSGGSFESSQRSEPVCYAIFFNKELFQTQASGLARGRGWSESDSVDANSEPGHTPAALLRRIG